MSVRRKQFLMDGQPVLIKTANGEVPVFLCSMSWRQAESFVESGRELLKKGTEATEKEWLNRTLIVVNEGLDRAGIKPEGDLLDSFDIPTVNEMSFFVLEMSGLRAAKGEVGESKAALAATSSN